MGGHRAQGANPKNKIASCFISKMNLFGNSRGIATGDKQTMEGQLLLGFGGNWGGLFCTEVHWRRTRIRGDSFSLAVGGG